MRRTKAEPNLRCNQILRVHNEFTLPPPTLPNQPRIQIRPLRIPKHNQLNLPCPRPRLDLLLPRNRRRRPRMKLKPNQNPASIPRRKSPTRPNPMFPNPRHQIRRNPRINRPIKPTNRHINRRLLHLDPLQKQKRPSSLRGAAAAAHLSYAQPPPHPPSPKTPPKNSRHCEAKPQQPTFPTLPPHLHSLKKHTPKIPVTASRRRGSPPSHRPRSRRDAEFNPDYFHAISQSCRRFASPHQSWWRRPF
jgi:hypothetical protein